MKEHQKNRTTPHIADPIDIRPVKQLLAHLGDQALDFLMVTPSLSLQPDPANSKFRSPSLAMAYILASVKKAGFSVKYVDMDACLVTVDRLVDYVQRAGPRLIGFTAVTITVKAAALIAERIKQICPECLICLGGVHATMAPRDTLTEFPVFDFLVRGEGEQVIPALLRRLDTQVPDLSGMEGVITQGGDALTWCRVEDIEALPFPAWEEFELARYPGVDIHRTRRELPVITARGCPYDCCFCCRQPGMRKVRRRSVSTIMEELIVNITDFRAEAIYFADETFTFNRDFARELCQAMIDAGLPRRIRWSCSTRVDKTDPDLFHLMRRAGCYDVFFGFESADDALLEVSGKGITTAQIRRAVHLARQAGLAVHGCFILGLPGETEATIEKAWQFAKELDLRGVSFPIAVPFPGTRLHAMAEAGEYGLRITSRNWDYYGKQYPGVMEQGSLTIEKLLYYQQKSYLNHPVKWDYPWPEDALDRFKAEVE
jgi:anaerobic magnesium-protoporphyrin IX monomethyl ester cyclase